MPLGPTLSPKPVFALRAMPGTRRHRPMRGCATHCRRRSVVDRAARPDYKPALSGLGQGSAQVAQLVEHATENRSVGGSIPPLGTILFNKIKSEKFSSIRAVGPGYRTGTKVGGRVIAFRPLTSNDGAILSARTTP
jgi:hypothetical protein